MASRDDVPAAVASRLANDEQKIAFGVSLEFDSGTLNLWSGIGDFTGSDSLSYTGAGELLDIQNVEEHSYLCDNRRLSKQTCDDKNVFLSP